MNLKSIFIAAVLALLLLFSVAHAKGDANTVKAPDRASPSIFEWLYRGDLHVEIGHDAEAVCSFRQASPRFPRGQSTPKRLPPRVSLVGGTGACALEPPQRTGTGRHAGLPLREEEGIVITRGMAP
jgi:hypothetical protein